MDRAPNQLVATTGALELEGFTELHAVASGGDSTIYRGTQTALDRDVAIKVVNLSTEEDVRRFQREIALTVKLGRAHPNIVTVLDTRTLTDGRPCIVMDFFELGSAHDRLRSTGPFPAEDVVSMGRVIADALGFAHAQRVVHRDVKPQNILILPTSYVLADFGIARSVDAGHTSSLDRLSYRHASPEVLDGRSPEPVDDLWSLCSTMATLLEGRAPFAADDPSDDTALAYLRRVRTGQRRPLPLDVPDGLRALIERGMDPDRSRRFGSAGELIDGLRDLERRTTGWAPGPGAGAPVAPPVPFRTPAPLATAAAAPFVAPAPATATRDAAVRTDEDGASTAPRARHSAREVVPPSEDQAGVGDLPAGSDDLGWAPGSAAPHQVTPIPPTRSEQPAAPIEREAPSLAPISADDLEADGEPAVRTTAGAAVDRDVDARISAGHARPAAAGPDAPAVSVAQQLARTAVQGTDRTAASPTGSGGAGPAAGGPRSAGQVPETDDAAPTGWRPSTAVSAPDTDPDELDQRPQARVRAGIIALAAVMLLISGTVAYFLARPTERTVTPIIDSPINVDNGSAALPTGPPIDQSDPEYVPDILSVKFEGVGIVRVTVRGPDAKDANLWLFDATNYDEKSGKGLRPLVSTPTPRTEEEGKDTVITAGVSFGRCQTVRFAVLGTNTAGGKAGIDLYPIKSAECADATDGTTAGAASSPPNRPASSGGSAGSSRAAG